MEVTDREKVVRAVETFFDSWIDKHRNMGLDLHEVGRMKRDALELLKGQEPKSVLSMRECETLPNHYERKGFCPKCHQVVEWYLNRSYCGFCGQAVKWE